MMETSFGLTVVISDEVYLARIIMVVSRENIAIIISRSRPHNIESS